MHTRTGQFPIGFRLGGNAWMNELPEVVAWAKEAGFACLESPKPKPQDAELIVSQGLKLACVDLPDWPSLLAVDAGQRKAGVAKVAEFIRDWSERNVRNFFCVVIPNDPELPRLDNYKLAVESFGALGAVAEKTGSRIVIEGWPGGGQLPNLCCNPETCRALFKDTGTKGLGINYDPSHLIRLGIDHIRFAEEFAERIGHVHGKDTEVFDEAQYEFGLYQPSLFEKPHRWGANVWRYTLPGHGRARWVKIVSILKAAGYKGAISVELEDENFNGTVEGVKHGLEMSLAFLKSI